METGQISNSHKVTLRMLIATWLVLIGLIAVLHILSVWLERKIQTAGLAQPPAVVAITPTPPNYAAQKLKITVGATLDAVFIEPIARSAFRMESTRWLAREKVACMFSKQATSTGIRTGLYNFAQAFPRFSNEGFSWLRE